MMAEARSEWMRRKMLKMQVENSQMSGAMRTQARPRCLCFILVAIRAFGRSLTYAFSRLL